MTTNPTSNEKRVCGPCPHGMGPLASDETCPWCQLERLRAALQLILPLAKGYSPPGQSESARRTCNEWIAAAEAQLSGDSSAPETQKPSNDETLVCDDCRQPTTWEHAVQADLWGRATGDVLCENCAESRWQRHQERLMETT